MTRSVRFETAAFETIIYWLNNDRKLLDRILRLITECKRTPFEGTGKPEPLKLNRRGFWSRRINDEHRLIYEVTVLK